MIWGDFLNLYEEYTDKLKKYLSVEAELSKYICDFFTKEGLGVFVKFKDDSIIVIEYQPQRAKEFDSQVSSFHNVVRILCEDLNLRIIYKESRRWDTCNDFPVFGKEIVFLVGDI